MLMGFKYQYALTSVPFDSSYENAIRLIVEPSRKSTLK